MVSVEAELREVLAGDAQKIMASIRQHEIEIETGSDRIGDQRKNISNSKEELEILSKELNRALNARDEANQKLISAKESLEGTKKSLDEAAKEEADARKAIESGDKFARDLNRALGKASEMVSSAQDAYAQAKLDSDRASQASQLASENLAD